MERVLKSRRRLLLGAMGALMGRSGGGAVAAKGHRQRRHKRCHQHCKSSRKTCDRGCDILDGDSQQFCKQGCRVALSQCKGNC